MPRGRVDDVPGEVLSRGDLDLLFDKVASVDLLGDRMLDLDAGVHLHEIKMPVIVDEELDGAGIGVADVLRQLDRGGAHLRTQFGRHQRGGTFLDDLLIASLDGTVAFPKMNDAAMLIAENLKFDVMGIDDELLDVDLGIAEGLLRLEACRMIALHEASFIAGDAHPASAAAGDRFDHDRKTDFSCDPDRFFLAIDDPSLPGATGTPALRAQSRANSCRPSAEWRSEEGR